MYSKIKNWLFTLISTFLLLFLIYTLWPIESSPSRVISLASDGTYALSSHKNGDVILWNIQKKTARHIVKHANANSAYFIKNGNNFLWQDIATNRVHIHTTAGQGVFSLRLDYPVKSIVMSKDFTRLYFTDSFWNLYTYHNDNLQLMQKGAASFQNVAKYLNLFLSSDDNYLLTAGKDLPVVWNSRDNTLFDKVPVLSGKIVATISPNNKLLVAGDEQGDALVLDLNSKKTLYKLIVEKKAAIFAVKFVDLQGNYLLFFKNSPVAVLYNVKDAKPQKTFNLAMKPKFALSKDTYNQTIDSAPAGNSIVLGHEKSGGLTVFRFDSQQQALKIIWQAS